MDAQKVFPAAANSVNENVPPDPQISRELNARALTSSLWLSLKAAQDGGFEAFIDPIGRLYVAAVSQRREVEE